MQMSKKKRIAAGAIALAAILLNVLIIKGVAVSLPVRLLLCAAVDAMAVVCGFHMETLLRLPLEIFRDRSMFVALVKNDFQARFAGSDLGIFWAIVHPLNTIGLYWFVFQFGLRSGNVSDHPFILFLMAGLVPWFYFSESWGGASGSLVEYNYLVKKVVFNVGFLPVIKICSALFVHLFFVAIVVVMTFLYGYGLQPWLLQLPYYILCMAVLVLGLSYITAACTVFFRDMTQVVNIVLTIGIWMTPIMWNAKTTMSPIIQKVFKLNPIYYIVDGFRDSLLGQVWFWEKPLWSIYFWCVAIVVYLAGIKLFNRLKVHFSDVL